MHERLWRGSAEASSAATAPPVDQHFGESGMGEVKLSASFMLERYGPLPEKVACAPWLPGSGIGYPELAP